VPRRRHRVVQRRAHFLCVVAPKLSMR
jgi:hypothetical protein